PPGQPGPYGQPYPNAPRPGRSDGPPNYGAPPGWTPATTPSGHPNNQWRPSWDPQPGPDDRRRDQSGPADPDDRRPG
ncbi:MAG: hypothetical protein GEV28_34040, partial [Actinophytocola sp.]|uniref:hypothetical protein n=1 Tax=Actinophytocola sp. TaxID=1872138 RepID=UPI001324743C